MGDHRGISSLHTARMSVTGGSSEFTLKPWSTGCVREGFSVLTLLGKIRQLLDILLQCDEDELHNLFKSFGEIKDIQLLRRPNKQPIGCGFVEFTSRLHADRAVAKLNGSQFKGTVLIIYLIFKFQIIKKIST